jgi:hypothetical protein
MRNTKHTAKELKAIYRNYIMAAIADSETILNEYGQKCDTEQERILFVLNDFARVANHPYNIKQFPNIADRMADWFMGLPAVINIEFRNYQILQLLEEWGVIAPDANEKTKDKYLSGWFRFIANQFIIHVCKYYKVDTLFIR